MIRSRTFTIEDRFIHSLVAGRGARINVVVDGFEKIRDPIYGGLTITVNHGDEPRWVTRDVGMWLGHTAYLEFADGAIFDFGGATTLSRMVMVTSRSTRSGCRTGLRGAFTAKRK